MYLVQVVLLYRLIKGFSIFNFTFFNLDIFSNSLDKAPTSLFFIHIMLDENVELLISYLNIHEMKIFIQK